MAKTRQPVVLNTSEAIVGIAGHVILSTDTAKSLISVPVISGDHVLGIIQIEDHEREYAFSESEVRLLTTIAASLGTALENARLFDETQRLLAETEQRAAELAIINSVGEAMASQLDVETITRLVGDKVQSILDAEIAAIGLIDEDATSEVADDLESSGFSLGGKSVYATVMFSDIRSFTTLVETQSPAETIELLNTYYTLMFEAIEGHGGVVNQMIGDGLMAVFGAPAPLPNHGEQAVRAAMEMVELVQLFNVEQEAFDKQQIRIGIGIATGQLIAGYTGTQRRATYTCVGDTVNLAARLESHTKKVETPILIDQNTQNQIYDGIDTKEQGQFQAKGKNQTVNIYSVLSGF